MSAFEELSQRLDDLLERYLELVDQYDQAQREIQKHFARGFFSLAQANARSNIGRRYGADWYDDRTKATTAVQIIERSGQSIQVKIEQRPQYAAKKAVEKDEAPGVPTTHPKTPGLPGGTDKNDHEKSSEDTKAQLDPLFWFGMLPPSQLRTAQASFKAVFQSDTTDEQDSTPIPFIQKALNASRELRSLEADIRKQRKLVRQAEKLEISRAADNGTLVSAC